MLLQVWRHPRFMSGTQSHFSLLPIQNLAEDFLKPTTTHPGQDGGGGGRCSRNRKNAEGRGGEAFLPGPLAAVSSALLLVNSNFWTPPRFSSLHPPFPWVVCFLRIYSMLPEVCSFLCSRFTVPEGSCFILFHVSLGHIFHGTGGTAQR